ncbi:hypothetical protein F5148DRAFT_1146162 [Russula earlei]|uniref:Uncharacterized protein n=1 Tax=Russula earlei TaxID=71964 RepID=A0ACC0UN24_9AGAM|nr:hypothetical protein F5148DRAFT_1146162 [Russula earlei]
MALSCEGTALPIKVFWPADGGSSRDPASERCPFFPPTEAAYSGGGEALEQRILITISVCPRRGGNKSASLKNEEVSFDFLERALWMIIKKDRECASKHTPLDPSRSSVTELRDGSSGVCFDDKGEYVMVSIVYDRGGFPLFEFLFECDADAGGSDSMLDGRLQEALPGVLTTAGSNPEGKQALALALGKENCKKTFTLHDVISGPSAHRTPDKPPREHPSGHGCRDQLRVLMSESEAPQIPPPPDASSCACATGAWATLELEARDHEPGEGLVSSHPARRPAGTPAQRVNVQGRLASPIAWTLPLSHACVSLGRLDELDERDGEARTRLGSTFAPSTASRPDVDIWTRFRISALSDQTCSSLVPCEDRVVLSYERGEPQHVRVVGQCTE